VLWFIVSDATDRVSAEEVNLLFIFAFISLIPGLVAEKAILISVPRTPSVIRANLIASLQVLMTQNVRYLLVFGNLLLAPSRLRNRAHSPTVHLIASGHAMFPVGHHYHTDCLITILRLKFPTGLLLPRVPAALPIMITPMMFHLTPQFAHSPTALPVLTAPAMSLTQLL
jgi:hypothetical protein